MTKNDQPKSSAGKVITSAIIGAAAGAAAVALSDKRNRDALKKKAKLIGKKVSSKLQDAKGMVQDATEHALETGKQALEENLETAKKKIEGKNDTKS